MMRILGILVLTLGLAGPLLASEGVIKRESPFDVTATAQRLVAVLEEKGLTVFARVDHAAGAQGVGLSLRPTELVIFGNPRVGTPLMQCRQEVALDLPQKALVWEDADGRVWLGYNDPAWLAERHAVAGCAVVLEKIGNALAAIAAAVVTP